MDNDFVGEFLKSALFSLFSSAVNFAFQGTVSWYIVFGSFVLSLVSLIGYQYLVLGKSSYRKWKVEEGGLINMGGTKKGDIWEFDKPESAIYGPYVPLAKGRYRVTYRLKIDARNNGSQHICELDVTADAGKKWFAKQSIAIKDFKKSDAWEKFHIDMNLHNPENHIEFRCHIKFSESHRLSFDHIKVRRLLF